MRSSVFVLAALVCFLSYIPASSAQAQEADSGEDTQPAGDLSYGMLDDPDDPQNQLTIIRERRAQKDALFPVSPLQGLHDRTTQGKENLHEKYGLEPGMNSNTLFQWLGDSLPGTDTWGVATTLDLIATWELVNRGKPNQGQIFGQIEGRWDYGTPGPTNLGPTSLGSLGFTANIFAAYTPTFLPIRNLYWQQGSKQAGWLYRGGRITPDQIFSTSAWISPALTFTPISGTGPFAIALPDSGWGVMGTWFISDRVGLIGVVSDANANRQDLGDIGAGDYFKAIELGAQIVTPRTPKAGYSKLTLWHTDGTSDGQPINGMTGPSGWGFFLKHEQELSADGRVIGILRYGKSYDGSALYRQQAGVHWLLNDPHFFGSIQNDLMGVAFNWVEATGGIRDEYNAEVFYRFPFFPGLDTTFSYQAVINPALDLGVDFASVFSFRFRMVY
jgi:hypothetical protein